MRASRVSHAVYSLTHYTHHVTVLTYSNNLRGWALWISRSNTRTGDAAKSGASLTYHVRSRAVVQDQAASPPARRNAYCVLYEQHTPATPTPKASSQDA